jgi:capsular polysaccharide biosynthesis protein
MKTVIAFVAGLIAGVGLTFGLAILAGRDAQRQMAAAGG